MQVLIGTTNPAKLKFFQDALSEYDVDLVTLNDLGSSLSLTDIAVEGEARLEELFGKEEDK